MIEASAPATRDTAPDFMCDPHTAAFQTHLREIYRTLRNEHPVYHNPERGTWGHRKERLRFRQV